MNRDKLTNADPKHVAQSTFSVIDKLQNMPQHLQAMALASSFLILSDVFKLEAQDIFTLTKNLMNSKEGLRPEFVAVRDYIKHELVP